MEETLNLILKATPAPYRHYFVAIGGSSGDEKITFEAPTILI